MEKSTEIIEMLAKQLNKKPADMTPEKRIKEDLGADSLDVVEILMNIEDKYGITVPDDASVTMNNSGTVTVTGKGSGTSSSDTQSPIVSNRIILDNVPVGTKVEVYNLRGERVYSTTSHSHTSLKIEVQTKGMYIVRIGNQTQRMVVR